jgi:hypothetical protein
LRVLRLREEEEERGGLRLAHDVVAGFEECKSFFSSYGVWQYNILRSFLGAVEKEERVLLL